MQHQRKTIISTRLSRSLGLGSRLTTLADALEDALTVLVELQLADDDLGGVDADGDALAVGLLADDTLNVDDVFETVDAGDLALTALVGATDDGDLVVLADGQSADLAHTCQIQISKSQFCSCFHGPTLGALSIHR